MSNPESRRAWLTRLAIVGLAAVLPVGRPRAAVPLHLDVKDPAAQAQGYVEDAAQVEAKKYPAFVSGQSCGNCLLLEGKEGESYRPCSIFPGKLVNSNGWCKSWTPEI